MNPINDKFEEVYIVRDPFERSDYITMFLDGHYYTSDQLMEYTHKRIEEHTLSKQNERREIPKT